MADGVDGEGVAEPDRRIRHSDDELADALQAEVDRVTAAVPIIAGPTVVRPDAAALSDDEVTAIVDADLRIHDTTAAIAHLQSVLDARAATSSIPVVGTEERVREAEPRAAEVTAAPVAGTPVAETPVADKPVADEPDADSGADDEDEDEDDWAGPPTQLISFDDLPVRKRDTGPQPTYSAWVGAAVPQPKPTPPKPPPPPAPPAAVAEDVSPPKFPAVAMESPAAGRESEPPADTSTPARVEPLGLVPEEFAPRDSQPVPLISDVLPSAPVVVLLAAQEPLVAHDLGATTARPDHIDGDVADDADDVRAGAPTPVATPRLPDGSVLFGAPPAQPPPFVPETADLEPTPLEQRAGRASRLFWLWFAGTSSLISIGVGATLFLLGLSLRQLLVATLVGVALSFLPLGLGTLAGKWSGQPTMVVSRAAFGLLGNAVPTALALVTKVFWGAVLLWLAAAATGSVAIAGGWSQLGVGPTTFALLVTVAVAGVVAYFGYGLLARVQLVLTIASAVLIVVMIAATWRHVDLTRALGVPDAVWTHVVTGAVLVFSYVGLAWAMSSAEVARYQRPKSSGAAGMLWATFGAGVPPFVLVSYGGLLAASDPSLAADIARDPVAGLTRLGLPAWYPVPLLLAVGLSLISALVLTMYSGGFTLDALGVRLGRRWSTVIVAGAIAVAGVALTLTVRDLDDVVRGVPTTLAVPVAAWAGLFTGEMMLRTRRFHQPSLLTRGGVYPDWRWPNLAMLVVASALGLGFVSSSLPWLAWEGYLFRTLGVDPHAGIGASNVGVVIALAVGLLTPMVSGIPAVRRQERAQA
ncbi:cytosine permease [Leifsonia shinshuensis]|uniref:purine-cytosine permease family protein n=1 Tax=Leifsonia shinshuensis TaxID=150026 RepID=UPI001F51484A|nr:cytosine permease [Leifsonia shinshuensis]MCI0155829.1 cytosine permease [Leifsonia shinshuensis]